MRILVTGGAGFIGSNLARALVARGDEVVVLDDLSTGLAGNLAGVAVDLRLGSVIDVDAVASAVEGVEAVVHLAALGSVPRSVEDPVGCHEVNATGTLVVLEAARSAGAHVVFSSSSAVYGANPLLPKREEMWTQPLSPYGASKLAAESYVMSYREVYGLDALVLRLFNVYGPWQRPDHAYAAVIPRLAWRALAGEPLVVDGDGEQTRDFTHVDSVVGVLVDALNRRISADRPVNLAFGGSVSVNDVVVELGRELGHEVRVQHGPARVGDVRDSRADPTLLRALFPDAADVPFPRGLASTLDWMRQWEAIDG